MSRLIDENDIIKMLNTMDRYTSEELTLCDTDKTFPMNEVFIVDDIFEGLDELPSAQPEPQRTGRWIYADTQCGIKCSLCKTPVDDFCGSIDYVDLYYEPNFCPNCGARMKEPEDIPMEYFENGGR